MSNESRTCPQCGAAITGDAPQGLCPKCLLAGVALGTEPGELTGPHGTKILQPAPALDAVRAAFPQLEVLQLIGRGGMGVVYQARQKSLNRLVALKLLAPERVTDAKFAERFTREAQALARLSHPNIVTIHDFGVATPPPTPDAIPHPPFYFLLMEFVDGVNLRQAMKAGRFTPEQALAIVPPVCDALQYAHERGIVHRDIKPENLLLDKDGRVKIADFGIAKMLGESGTGVPPVSEEHTGGTPVPHSVAAGTPQYMAPEQREHHRTDHRADIYSLGVVLYELLTGELPGKRLEAPSRKVQIDVRLDEIVLRALEVKPELRYQTAGELRSQVQTVVSTPRASETPAIHAGDSSLTKTCRCYVSTPEHLATIWGKIYIYTGNGRLVLDANNLTFIEAVGNTTIPLGSIRALSIGEYPRLTKPTGLDFISVAFEDAGRVRELYFTPNEGGFRPTWDTNRIVAEWFTAIRDAATNATGRAPAAKPKDRLTASPGLTAILAITLVAALLATFLGSFLILGLVRQFSGESETAPFNGTLFWLVLVCVLALLGAMLFGRRIGRAGKAGGPAADSPSDRTHSRMQAALQRLLPASWFEAIRRESLEWKMVCDCGWKTSIWDVGDIRFKASGRRRRSGWCPQCRQQKSMALVRLLTGAAASASPTPGSSRREEAPPASPTADGGQFQTPADGWRAPRTGWGYLVGTFFGITFTSPLAYKLANLSALGFLGFLGFVGLSGIDELRWCRGFFGLSGFFGLIGIAFIIELARRRDWNTRTRTAASPSGSSRREEAPSEQSAFRSPHSAMGQSLLTSAATGRLWHAPALVLALIYSGLLWLLFNTASQLPPRVATHFNFEGRPNGWASDSTHLWWMALFPVGLTALLVGVTRLVARFPSLANIPRRDYWLAPERRAFTANLLLRWMLILLCPLTLFFGALHWLTLQANLVQPPQLSTGALLFVIIAFLFAILLWIAMLLMRLAEVDRYEAAIRAQFDRTHPGRWRKRAASALLAVVIALVLRTWLLNSYTVRTNALAPELPAGSMVLAWKLARDYVPGDLVVYRAEGFSSVGRVTGQRMLSVLVNRNGVKDFRVNRVHIEGKVISVLWRGNVATSLKTAPTNSLLAKESVESARSNLATFKLLAQAGRATPLAVLEAEQHLQWAEAMHAGDRVAAARAKRDGARRRLDHLEGLLTYGRATRAELAPIERELAEAEAELKALEAQRGF